MKNKWIILFFLLSTFICPAHNWLQKKGECDFRGGFSYIKADGYFDNDGEVKDFFNFSNSNFIVRVSGLYGISDRITISTDLPLFSYSEAQFKFADSNDQSVSASGIGDVGAGLKYCFFIQRSYFANLCGSFTLPSGNDDNDYRLNTGYGSFTETIKAEAGYTFSPKIYIQAYSGFVNKSDGFTDDIISGGDASYRFLPKLEGILKCEAINPLENGDDEKKGGLPGLYANNSGYILLGLEAQYEIAKGWGLFAAALYPVKGQWTQSGVVYRAGITFQIKHDEE